MILPKEQSIAYSLELAAEKYDKWVKYAERLAWQREERLAEERGGWEDEVIEAYRSGASPLRISKALGISKTEVVKILVDKGEIEGQV